MFYIGLTIIFFRDPVWGQKGTLWCVSISSDSESGSGEAEIGLHSSRVPCVIRAHG